MMHTQKKKTALRVFVHTEELWIQNKFIKNKESISLKCEYIFKSIGELF